ncbi:MAG: FAD-dependent oxidoreductase [Rubrivivax sp.]|nr:FAD-dependent oxidoreductase [Rubrivivax sp.]
MGSAIARELSGYGCRVVLVEARSDVGDGISKANTAILHTGFDAKPGTLESRLVRRGWQLLSDYAGRTGIPVERTGAMLVAWTAEEAAALPGLAGKAIDNGYTACELVDSAEVYRLEPHLGAGALAGLRVPDESITCTWTTSLALATDAVNRGSTLLLRTRVVGASQHADASGPLTVLQTEHAAVRARFVVNAAGLHGDHVDALFGYQRFTVTPRRGELLVYDKHTRALVSQILLPVPGRLGKGVLVSPTVYGNVILGPTAEELDDRSATQTSARGFEFLLDKGKRILPALLEEEVTASYAGLRAGIGREDYLIDADAKQRYVLVGGIRSTGLSACMAIAEYVRGLLDGIGLRIVEPDNLPPAPRMPNLGEAFLRPYQDAARIAHDPAYGSIVCFCERVTEGEIRDACNSTLAPHDLAGLRRRTRAMNGRCQAFYCGASVQALFERRSTSPAAWADVPERAHEP